MTANQHRKERGLAACCGCFRALINGSLCVSEKHSAFTEPWVWVGAGVKALKVFKSLGLSASFDKGNAIWREKK